MFSGNILSMKTDVDVRRQTQANTADTLYEKTTGESSTAKQQCDYCGRWFENLSNHRKCSSRSRPTSHADVLDTPRPSRRTSRSGIITKYALKKKAIQSTDEMLQVCDILITVLEIHN